MPINYCTKNRRGTHMESKLNVILLSHTPDPEKVVASAAKLCYSASDIQALTEKQTPEKVKAFLERLSNYGHMSPVEHISFTFGIEGVSRSLTHQLVRHRLASYSQKSQRYVTEGPIRLHRPAGNRRHSRSEGPLSEDDGSGSTGLRRIGRPLDRAPQGRIDGSGKI
jgi:flavin-dependent thymidylate synthase